MNFVYSLRGKSHRYFLLFISVTLFSCSNTASEKANLVKVMADLECRAIALKNRRFQLADNIRFAQDTLLHFKTTTDTVLLQQRLTEWNRQKLIIVNQSLSLADSIKLQMDTVMKRYFTNKKEEATFNILLQDALTEKRCK